MKCLLFILLSIYLCFFGAFTELAAQSKQEPSLRSPFLFEDFTFGKVHFKSGVRQAAYFNYNIVTEEMIFLKDEVMWALKPTGVDTIYINGRKFTPFADAFSEILQTSVGVLYVRHKANLQDQGNPAAYGGYSPTTNSGSLTNTAIMGSFQALEGRLRYYMENDSKYWVRTKLHFYEAHSLKHLQKAFPDKRKEIEKLARQQGTDFSKPESVVALLELLQQ